MNVGAGGTCQPHWTGKLPEIIGLIIIAVLALTWFRRWQQKQHNKQMKRAMAQSLARQSVTATLPFPGPAIGGPDSAFKGYGARSLD